MIDGILGIDKPQGWTSHDVVARVRRITGQRQVGHAGTLDPLATGLLLLVLGRATRVSSYLMDSQKVYRAEVVLGATTVTDDAEGTVLEQQPVPDLCPRAIERCLQSFVGDIDQVPPAYAAVRQGGERLYRLARKGVEIEPESRRVTIHEIGLEWIDLPRLRLRVRCAAGTYIRALARDLGAALGCGGYLHALRRIASGGFSVRDALPLEGLTREAVFESLHPIDRAVIGWPAAVLTPSQLEAVRHGQPVVLGDAPAAPNGYPVRLYGPSGDLAALGTGSDGAVRPFRVFLETEPDAHVR